MYEGFLINTTNSLTVTNITPNIGMNDGLVSITNLSGTSFKQNANVYLSKTGESQINATNISVISSSLITCTFNLTDVATGPWNVTVQNPDGETGTLYNGFAINSISYLSVTSITPNTGLNTGSVTITSISGDSFEIGATVNLTRTGQQNITAGSVQVVSPTQITCVIPLAGKSAGQWNVVVTNPGGQTGSLLNGFTITAPSPGNTPYKIDPSKMNTFDGQYLSSRGYGWCDFGGKNNSYYKITLSGSQQYPTEFHLVNSFTTKAQFGILLQASNVRISGIDLSTALNADQRPVNSITNIYAPLLLAETGAAGIKIPSGYNNIKLVNVNVDALNVPAIHVDGSNVDLIGTNNPDPYLTTYTGCGINENWGTTLIGRQNSGYGLGLLQQTQSRSSAITITGSGGNGVNIMGPFSGIELNGKTASLAINGEKIHITGTGTESGTGYDRNSGISAWGGSSVLVSATDSSIIGQEYGIYGQGGAIININCPNCTIGPIGSSSVLSSSEVKSQAIGSLIQGGKDGLFLTGTSTPGFGKVTIENTTVLGQTGYGINFSQAGGYAITITNPTEIQGGQGKLGASESESNQITIGSVNVTTGATGPYLVNISLDAISGPDPYNLLIFNESGGVVYDITNWSSLPEGITYTSSPAIVSFASETLEIYSAKKYPSSGPDLSLTSIEPTQAQQGCITQVNISGIFNPVANATTISLTRFDSCVNGTDVTVESSTLIRGIFSLPPEIETGSWQVNVIQDETPCAGNVTFNVTSKPLLPSITTLPANNVSSYSAQISGNLTSTGGTSCNVYFGYGTNESMFSTFTTPILLTGPGIVTANISNLIPETPWFYAAFANNTMTEIRGDIMSFTTNAVNNPPIIKSVLPSSGIQGNRITITNLSGFFNTSAYQTNVILTGLGVNISAENVSVVSSEQITCTLSLPVSATPGQWRIMVEQNGQWSNGDILFEIGQTSYIIHASASPGGNITPSGEISVLSGSNQTFLITADPGYHLGNLIIDNMSTGAAETYLFHDIYENHTISAEFIPNSIPSYIITAIASPGGNITPSGEISVLSGLNQTFFIAADSGYRIVDVMIDNMSIGSLDRYTFENVTSPHRIEGIFEKMGIAPIITHVHPTSVRQNSVVTLYLSGQNFFGNERVDLTRNGSDNRTGRGILFQDRLIVRGMNLVGAPVGLWNIQVTNLTTGLFGIKRDAFTIDPAPQPYYTIYTVDDEYGDLYPSGPVRVRTGSHKTFRIRVTRGAEIVNVTVDGTPIILDHNNGYTFFNVRSDHTITLNTGLIPGIIHANFTVNQTSGKVPLTVQFIDTSSGNPDRWLWNFGDRTTSTLQNPVHTYTKPGKYSIQLGVKKGNRSDMIILREHIWSISNRNLLIEPKSDDSVTSPYTLTSVKIPIVSMKSHEDNNMSDELLPLKLPEIT